MEQASLEIFSKVSDLLHPFLVGGFILRVLLGQGSSESLKGAIRGLIMYTVATLGFPHIISLICALPDAFSELFKSTPHPERDLLKRANDLMIMGMFGVTSVVTISALYGIVTAIFKTITLLMCGIAPVVFLTSFGFGLPVGVGGFLSILVFSASWPIVWCGIDMTEEFLKLQENSSVFGDFGLELGFGLLRLFFPFYVAWKSTQIGSGAVGPNTLRSFTTAIQTARSVSNLAAGGGPAPSPSNSSRGRGRT